MVDKRPIGIFDSGVGGLTVFKEISKKLPCEHLIYLGDTARLPYGDKSPQTVIRYSLENVIFLLEKDIKALVVACNTASAYAIELLKKMLKIPVLGVIEPGSAKAVEVTKAGKIAVLGTRATIQSKSYEKEIKSLSPNAKVLPLACPLFVPLVEENMLNHKAIDLIAKDYLKPALHFGADTVLLGCTHYPLLKDVIQKHVGTNVTLVDSAVTCAELLRQNITTLGLESVHGEGIKQFFVSDDSGCFRVLGERILGKKIDSLECFKPGL